MNKKRLIVGIGVCIITCFFMWLDGNPLLLLPMAIGLVTIILSADWTKKPKVVK